MATSTRHFRPSFIACAIGAWLAACTAGPPRTVAASPLVTSPSCRVATPRFPDPLGPLEWVRAAGPAEHVLSGPSVPPREDVPPNDPEAASTWITIREIDLDADGACDLVVNAIDWTGSGHTEPGHTVFWLAGATGWRRQGPQWRTTSAGYDALVIALVGPHTREEFLLYDFGNYAPVKLPDGRVVLVVHVQTGVEATNSAPVLAWDTQTRAVAPLALDPAALVAFVEKFCVEQQSNDPACATW